LDLLCPLLPREALDRPPALPADPKGIRDTIFAGRLPRAGANSAAELRAYSGFGRYLGWLRRSGTAPDFPVSLLVIRYAFGGKVQVIDFAEESVNENEVEARIRPIRTQLNAIRSGAAAVAATWDADADRPEFPAEAFARKISTVL
jgi:hypothetical protein